MNRESFDFIVVGGGSAGCIAAAELARMTGVSVLLLEGGERAEANPETLTADGYKYAFANDRLMFERFTEPQAGGGKKDACIARLVQKFTPAFPCSSVARSIA